MGIAFAEVLLLGIQIWQWLKTGALPNWDLLFTAQYLLGIPHEVNNSDKLFHWFEYPSEGDHLVLLITRWLANPTSWVVVHKIISLTINVVFFIMDFFPVWIALLLGSGGYAIYALTKDGEGIGEFENVDGYNISLPKEPYYWLWMAAFFIGFWLTVVIPLLAYLSGYIPGLSWTEKAVTTKSLFTGIGCLLVYACSRLSAVAAGVEEVCGITEGILLREGVAGHFI